ncbi:MAG TPA: nicotinamidase [Geomonas sp.]|nr:nicotinamidase [Geomonas sp.]
MPCTAALLVVDVQRDFCPGGALPVPKGDQVVSVLNRYLQLFAQRGCPIFLSRDWHPRDSHHFKEFGGKWPVHCVKESEGAGFHPDLLLPEDVIVISKGTTRWNDGYSALQGITGHSTTCSMLLRSMAVERLYVGGLATDYCVRASALDALREGFAVTLLTDAMRGVDLTAGDSERAVAEMVAAGAGLASLESIGSLLASEGT